MSSFVSLFPATTMLVAIGFRFRGIDRWRLGLFSIGVVTTAGIRSPQTAGLWRGASGRGHHAGFCSSPTAATNFISAMACGAPGSTTAGLVFWAPGIFPAQPGAGDSAQRLLQLRLNYRRFYGTSPGITAGTRAGWPVAPGLASHGGEGIR